MDQEPGKRMHILLIEDNPGDVTLIEEILKDSRTRNALHVARDGEQATKFLRRMDGYAKAPRPDVIVLDLNLPRKNGRELLQEIKSDPDLKSIPIVVLTSSESEEDITRSYELQANCYITKPVELAQFTRVVRSMADFWFTIVKLPSKEV
ncbi:MAG: Response regulator rcp1 [Syntrophorhabdaceae bacterium PtaU1.Bin034]|jgi:CheY-like chemotaxis protein|nr:MAG: Response regulator rcp1 [Syntrophorhabdaceae bacterium PtaU1.Bin034]